MCHKYMIKMYVVNALTKIFAGDIKISIIIMYIKSGLAIIQNVYSCCIYYIYGRKGPQNPPYWLRAVSHAPGHMFPRSGLK